MIILPILATIFAIVYVVSPADFLPEAVLGPVGFTDDAIAVLIAIGAWFIYFSLPLLKLFMYVVISGFMLFGLIYLLFYLYQKYKKIK